MKRYWLWGALILGAVLFWVWRTQPPQDTGLESPPEDLFGSVTEVLGSKRLFKARLTGYPAYTPMASDRQNGVVLNPQRGSQLARWEWWIRSAKKRKPSAASFRAGGHWHLLADRDEDAVDRAIADLKSAHFHAPVDAAILNDLAAAYFIRAQRQDQAMDLLLALDTVEQALQRDGHLREALFNRGLILTELYLGDEARSAWKAFLAVETDPGWTGEARQELARKSAAPDREFWPTQWPLILESVDNAPLLQERIKPYRAEVKRELELNLFLRWAEASREGDSERATEFLEKAIHIAEALHQLEGDPMQIHLFSAIAKAQPGPATEGCYAFASALQTMRKNRYEVAVALFERVRTVLAVTENPLQGRAAYYQALCHYYLQQYGPAAAILDKLAPWAKVKGYIYLQGETLWIAGLTQIERGNPDAAFRAYEQALSCFETLEDRDRLAGVFNLMAEAAIQLGDYPEAWRFLLDAFSTFEDIDNPKRTYQLYWVAAHASRAQGLPDIALLFQDQARRAAEQTEHPETLIDAHLWRARILARLERYGEARRAVDAAESFLAEIADKKMMGRAQMEIQLALAEVYLRDQPELAITSLQQAIAFNQETGFVYYQPLLFLAQARAQLATGAVNSAMQTLAECLGAFEQGRAQVRDRRRQIQYFERAAEAFEEMIRLQLQGSHDLAGLDYSEQKRARALLESFSRAPLSSGKVSSEAAPLYEAQDIEKSLPSQTALIVFQVLGDELWACVVSATTRWELLGRLDEVEPLVDKLRDSCGRRLPLAKVKPVAGQVHEILIRPLLPHVGDADTLVFIPDGPLHKLPIAPLFDLQKDAFLIETYQLATAPSANFYLRSLNRNRELGDGGTPERDAGPRVLALGNPAFDRARYPRMSPLPGAENEVLEIGRLHPANRVFIGPDATESLIFERAGHYPILHFACHALVNAKRPQRSLFLLAPEKDSDGLLYAAELQEPRLQQTRLAVLSACATGEGAFSRNEGVASLARPFLAAGVPAVIASLWEVHDRATTRLMQAFYRRLLEGGNARTALREAQLAMLRAPEGHLSSPGTWAAFQLMGHATFPSR